MSNEFISTTRVIDIIRRFICRSCSLKHIERQAGIRGSQETTTPFCFECKTALEIESIFEEEFKNLSINKSDI